VPFHSKEDLAEKIIYYLKHEEERQSIASEGLRKANELFSSRRFWEQILQKTNLIKRQT
jgi:spore maturation protein CgeB